MSLASAAGKPVLRYLCTAAGYDSTNTRLIDQEANGLHAPLLAGTPAFATRSGATTLTMHGDVYFGPPLIGGQPVVPLPTRFTAVAVIWPFLAGTDRFDFMVGCERDYADADPAWQTPTDTFGSATGAGTGTPASFGPRMMFSGNGSNAIGGSLNYNSSIACTPSAWNVMQLVADPDNSQFRVRVGQGAWSSIAIAANRQLQGMDDWRLGYKSSAIDLTNGHDFAMAQFMIFNGLPATDNDTAYEALINALIANPLAQ